MLCRRCLSADLLALEVCDPRDYPVYRCRRCGFLFSPGPAAAAAESSPERERKPETAAPSHSVPGHPIPSGRRRA